MALAPVNILTSASSVMTPATHGRYAFARFVTSDQNGAAFRRPVRVEHGKIVVGPDRNKGLCGFRGLDTLHVVVVEQLNKNGLPEKIMYGWKKEEEVGRPDLALSAHVVARKENGSWERFVYPERIFGPESLGEVARVNATMIEFLLSDTGEKVFEREWEVVTRTRRRGKAHPKTGKRRKIKAESFLVFKHQGQGYYIRGLNGFKKVFIKIYQSADEAGNPIKRVDVYKNRGDEKALGSFCWARKIKGNWQLINNAEIIKPVAEYQTGLALRAAFLDFIRSDQPKGAVFIFEKWPVRSNGEIEVKAEPNGHALYGFSAFIRQGYVYAELRQHRKYKLATIWANKEARLAGKAPLRQEVKIAEKKGERWELITETDTRLARLQRENTKYQEFVFTDQPGKRMLSFWPVTKRGRGEELEIHRRMAGKELRFYGITQIAREQGVKEIFTVTYEAGGGLKIIELYPALASYRAGQAPFKAAVIAYKDKKSGRWRALKLEFEERATKLADLIGRIPDPLRLKRAKRFQTRHPEFAGAAIAAAEQYDRGDRITAGAAWQRQNLMENFRANPKNPEAVVRKLVKLIAEVQDVYAALTADGTIVPSWAQIQSCKSMVRVYALRDVLEIFKRYRMSSATLKIVYETLTKCYKNDPWAKEYLDEITAIYQAQMESSRQYAQRRAFFF